jgi:hypothetical protein
MAGIRMARADGRKFELPGPAHAPHETVPAVESQSSEGIASRVFGAIRNLFGAKRGRRF